MNFNFLKKYFTTVNFNLNWATNFAIFCVTLLAQFINVSHAQVPPVLKEDPYNQLFMQTLPNISGPKQIQKLSDCKKLAPSNQEWCKISRDKKIAINKYYESNPELAKQFVLGPAGQGQVPFILLRTFQDLFPSIWGSPEDGFSKIGLYRNTVEKNFPLPLGLTIAPSMISEFEDPFDALKKFRLNYVSFNCLACHANAVQIDSSGKKHELLLGAPNTRIDNQLFLVARTTLQPNFNAETFLKFIREQPEGSFYKSPQMLEVEKRERAYLLIPANMERIVTEIKTSGGGLLGLFQKYLAPVVYSGGDKAPAPLGPKRGSMDALLPTYLNFAGFQLQLLQKNLAAVDSDPKYSTPEYVNDPAKKEADIKMAKAEILKAFNSTLLAVLPHQAAESDSTSIWNQRDRGGNHWDGGLTEHMHRNTGSAAATLNKPVNLKNIKEVNAFIDGLPSDPYPFEVNMKLARRGESIFKTNCLQCHSGPNKVVEWDQVKTDKNRLDHFTLSGAAFLPKILKINCFDPELCNKPDGTSYADQELVRKTNGYVAGKLDGIWARSPYFHNGSVPNLRVLLTNERPNKFYRGSLKFDKVNVGYVSEESTKDTELFDTSLDGNSNTGHNYNSEYWKNNIDETNALLEYLKTL